MIPSQPQRQEIQNATRRVLNFGPKFSIKVFIFIKPFISLEEE